MCLNSDIPVIAIDGPSASGKGTVAQQVAEVLGFHYLDSGALYRIVALAATQTNTAWHDSAALAALIPTLDIAFTDNEIYLNQACVSEAVRSEHMSQGASQVAVHALVRQALLHLQHQFKKPPGLVADGRDMASVVFPEAVLKIFLTADVTLRAQRRFKQLSDRGQVGQYQAILDDLQARDRRDSERVAAPLIQTSEALLLDTSARTIEEAVQFVLAAYQNLQLSQQKIH